MSTDDAKIIVSVAREEDRPLIDEPKDNDVILGRGFFAREFRGTKRYRDLLHERAADYTKSTTQEDKDQVAIQVIRSIQANGGRFLQQLQPAEVQEKRGLNNNDSTKNVCWMELETTDLLRRTKQALRDTFRKKSQSTSDETAADPTKQSPALQPLAPYPPAEPEVPLIPQGSLSNLGSVVRQPPLAFLNTSSRGLFSYANRADTYISAFDPETHPGPGRRTAVTIELLESHSSRGREAETLLKLNWDDDGQEELEDLPNPWQDTSDNETSSLSDQATYTDDEKGAAEFLLNLLTEDSRLPRMSAEELQREKLQLTEEERQDALADMFGDICMISHRDKRTKRPEPGTIKALLREMRSEIDKVAEKPALLKAMHDASPHEFHDNRLELFLHCEKKDPRKAAERFVAYWEFRRKWFGEKKFCLPLTLDGALRDDTVALEHGTARLIPGLDLSGRSILYFACANHPHETESMLRALWYIHEAAIELSKADGGVVIIYTAKLADFWQIDTKLAKALTTMQTKILPITICAAHQIDLNPLVRWVFLPIWLALTDKSLRNRHIVHDAPGPKRMEKFGSHGITEDLVPVELGGKCKLDHSAWLSMRRALGK